MLLLAMKLTYDTVGAAWYRKYTSISVTINNDTKALRWSWYIENQRYIIIKKAILYSSHYQTILFGAAINI